MIRGLTPAKTVQKFGRNPDVDTTSDPEDIWDGGGVWAPPTTARTHDIASTSIADTSAGTGARTVTIYGLDSSGDEQSETVSMNGVTNVPTSNTYTMIHRMIVATAGSGGVNAGDITATAQTDATVTAQITTDMGQTLMAIYEVPTGYTAYLLNVYASLNKSGGASAGADMRLMAQPSGGAWQTKFFWGVFADGSSHSPHVFDACPEFDAGTILKVQASEVGANNTDLSAGFDLVLYDSTGSKVLHQDQVS